MKKVLIFSLAYYPKHVGGAEVAIKEITDRIPASDIEFHMLTLRFDSTLPEVEQLGNVLVHRIGLGKKGADISATHSPLIYLTKVLFVPMACVSAYRLHRKHTYDGFWAMMGYMTFPIALLRLASVQVPYAITLQEGDPFSHVFERWYIKPFLPLLRFGFRHATVVQTISTFLAGWAQRAGAQCPIEVVPNGVDIQHFTHEYSSEDLSPIRKKIGIKEGEHWLITTSRLVHKNAVDDVIASLALLSDSVKFAILGTGPDEEALRKQVADLGLESRVVFLGQVEHAELPKYLHACDIFIRPSRSEGMGNSFVEAMATGMPVIATQEGGIADFLFDAQRNPNKPATGWAVSKDNPHDIASAVEDIVAHPEKVEQITATAKTLVIEHYDWAQVGEHMQEKVFARLFNN